MRFFSWVILAVVLFSSAAFSAEPDERVVSVLNDLDWSFIEAHKAANSVDLATGGPIVLVRDGKLVLRRGETEVEKQIVLQEYETFKTFAHMAAAIYMMLAPEGEGRLDDERLGRLRDYLAKMQRVEENIDEIGLTGKSLERQKEMLARSKQFLEGVVAREEFSDAELLAFTRGMTPMIEQNIAGAAKSQLDAMHAQMMAWKQEMSPEEWSKLRVALKGPALARDGELAKQYFTRLLNLKPDSVRLVYMEMYYPPTPMLTLLATRSVDGDISVAVFDNPDRLFRDVLAGAATVYIKRLKFD